MFLLSRMNADTTNGEAARNMVVAGIGLGSMMQVFVLSVQNAVPRARIGAATALTQFSRQMGATLGVTVMGAIVNHGLPTKASHGAELSVIHRLPPVLRVALAHALHPAFVAATIVAVLVWLIALVGVKEVPLRESLDDIGPIEAAAGTPATGQAK
jgi:MFS family permease